jgi:hypothetical protein
MLFVGIMEIEIGEVEPCEKYTPTHGAQFARL